MNPLDHSLRRLLQAAARAPGPAPGPPPFGLDTRVLVQWRATQEEGDTAFLMAFFRRAVVCACVVMVLIAAWSLTRNGDTANELASANYEIQASLWP